MEAEQAAGSLAYRLPSGSLPMTLNPGNLTPFSTDCVVGADGFFDVSMYLPVIAERYILPLLGGLLALAGMSGSI